MMIPDILNEMDPEHENQVRLAAEAVKAADALLVTAGAGMGVDSGLPDFRGAHGFWRAYPAIAKLGLSFEEMANPNPREDDVPRCQIGLPLGAAEGIRRICG